MIFVGENLEAKVAQRTFRQVWGSPSNILRTPNICLLLHLWWKGTSAAVAPLLKGQRGKQAHNQLGTQEWRRVFCEGPTFFKTMSTSFDMQHIFPGGR